VWHFPGSRTGSVGLPKGQQFRPEKSDGNGDGSLPARMANGLSGTILQETKIDTLKKAIVLNLQKVCPASDFPAVTLKFARSLLKSMASIS